MKQVNLAVVVLKKWSAFGKDLCEAASVDALGSLPQGEQSSSTRRWKLT